MTTPIYLGVASCARHDSSSAVHRYMLPHIHVGGTLAEAQDSALAAIKERFPESDGYTNHGAGMYPLSEAMRERMIRDLLPARWLCYAHHTNRLSLDVDCGDVNCVGGLKDSSPQPETPTVPSLPCPKCNGLGGQHYFVCPDFPKPDRDGLVQAVLMGFPVKLDPAMPENADQPTPADEVKP